MSKHSSSALIRQQLKHPVIDSDGHSLDFKHLFEDYLRKVGGADMARRYAEGLRDLSNAPARWAGATPEQRLSERIPRPAWWAVPSGNALDLATAKVPKLLYERLPEAGIDVSVIFPGAIIAAGTLSDPEVRGAACRASNELHMDVFREFGDRIIPVACLPAHTPEEAIAELDYCVTTLGYRAALLPSYIRRPVPAYAADFPRTHWLDTYGVDSAYDYDPMWARFVHHKVVPTFHSSSVGMGFRGSVSNFSYNHIGHFAQTAEAVCKSLFMGGVTRRFPDLHFGFLEGGAAWAATLFADLLGHWQKRNFKALDKLNPARIDRQEFLFLCRKYGGQLLGDAGRDGPIAAKELDRLIGVGSTDFEQEVMDDFEAVGISSKQDMVARFLKPFYFGCEGDDPMIGVAFDTRFNPLGKRLNAVFGSDIGHFDVPEIAEVLEETWECVEDGRMSEEAFREFVFANPVRMWAGMNPDFFKGTVAEKEVARFLAHEPAHDVTRGSDRDLAANQASWEK